MKVIAAGVLNLDLEGKLVALNRLLPKPVDRSYTLRPQGNMASYEWSINGIVFDTEHPASQPAQIRVKEGQRATLEFVNETGMSYPMHLHGHSFQVAEINERPINGSLRDTVLVLPKSSVTVAFDENNPGVWYLHCHELWHLATGMATLVNYEA